MSFRGAKHTSMHINAQQCTLPITVAITVSTAACIIDCTISLHPSTASCTPLFDSADHCLVSDFVHVCDLHQSFIQTSSHSHTSIAFHRFGIKFSPILSLLLCTLLLNPFTSGNIADTNFSLLSRIVFGLDYLASTIIKHRSYSVLPSSIAPNPSIHIRQHCRHLFFSAEPDCVWI